MDIERLKQSLHSVEAIAEALDSLTYNLNEVYSDILNVLNDEIATVEEESIDDKIDKAFIQSDFEYLLIHNDDFRAAMKSGGSAAVGWIKANPSLLYSIYQDTVKNIENK